MSTTESPVKPLRRLQPHQKAAILAELGAGRTQIELAKEFNVHPNTIYNLWSLVRKQRELIPNDWKEAVLPRLQKTVERALDHEDVIGAANVALKTMHGIGYLSSDSKVHVDGNVALQVSWLPVQPPTEDAEILSISESDTSAETHDQ